LQADEQKKCSLCGVIKGAIEFYSKGNRTESRCRPCVLGIKKRTRQLKRAASIRKPRGRVIDISTVVFTIAPAQIGRAVLEEWTESVMGE